MSYFDYWDDAIRTRKGKQGLAKLKEADALHAESQRIKRAVAEGLLPGVTTTQAEAIEERVERAGNEAAWQIDMAEGWAMAGVG